MRPEPAPNGAADLGQPQQESLPALRGKPLGQPFLYLRQTQGDHKGGQDPGANGQGAAGDGGHRFTDGVSHGGGQGPDRIVREIHSAFKECGQAVLGHGLQILRQLFGQQGQPGPEEGESIGGGALHVRQGLGKKPQIAQYGRAQKHQQPR